MKLYATTTSERASKGQGGNEFIEVLIEAEKLQGIPARKNLFKLKISIGKFNELHAEILKCHNGEKITLL